MNAGFAVLCQGDGVEFHLFGRDAGGQSLLTFHQQAGMAAAFLGRLHYRSELPVSRLGKNESPAAVAAALYLREGAAGLGRLEGDFAVAVYDERNKRLVVSRDPLGGYPLYWTQSAGATAFSTALRPLVDRLPDARLDMDYLADYLMQSMGTSPEFSTRCVYEGVRRLPAGSTAQVRLPAGKVEQTRHWDWLERQVDPRTDRLEDVAGRYAEMLRGAVRERLCGTTAAHLLGGMDSTAVALLANEEVQAGRAEGPLHTLSLVYERLAGLNRETPYLEGVLARHPELRAHRLAGDELLDYDSFASPPLHDEPYGGLWRLAMDRATIEAAAGCGASTMLTGVGADQMLEAGPHHIGGLVRGGRWLAAWAEARRWARAENCSAWKILGPFGLAGLLPAGMRAGLRAGWRGGYATWEEQTPWTVAPWVLPAFARRHDLRGRAVRNVRRTYAGGADAASSAALAAIAHSTGDFHRWHLAAAHGLAVAHPFLDPRILTFSMGVLARLKAQPGQQKPVLAEAMRDVLPEEIRNRRRKGNFNEVYFMGLSRNLPRLEALVESAPDLGVFDRVELLRCLRKAALGHAADVNALNRLNLSLSLLRWLSLRPAWQAGELHAEVVRMGMMEEANRVTMGEANR